MVDNLSAVIAANRFGLGARPSELAGINRDARGWLKSQLYGARVPSPLISQLASSSQIYQTQVAALKARVQASQSLPSAAIQAGANQSTTRNPILENFMAQVGARYQLAISTQESFRERLIHFWTNHFAVSMDKNAVGAMAATLENEAIRPNLHRRFFDMLLAAESHPAMIVYLDNQLSIGPHSPMAQVATRRSNVLRKLDINENLGREILELHTLGVGGGYTQSDVTQFAAALTGWSIGDEQRPFAIADRLKTEQDVASGAFTFRDAVHEPGPQTILGKYYPEAGMDQAKAVLKDLSVHPATAKFIATKLARHFIADEPPASAVVRIAKAFLDSEGDLPTVHAAIVDCDEAWRSTSAKFKTPHELIVSAYRAIDYLPDRPQLLLQPLVALGQSPYSPGSPAGWEDLAGRWDGSDALMKRIEWAGQFAQRVSAHTSPLLSAQQSLGDALGEHTLMALMNAADRIQGTILWLVSPEFQRR